MSKTQIPDNAGLSIACALGASALFSIGDITVKSFATSLPLHEVVLVRSIVGLMITMFIFAPGQSLRSVLKTNRPMAHLFRGLCVVVANFTFFAGLAVLPLAEASAIFFVAPLMITAFSALLLGEYVGPWRWSALCIGMIGVLLIVKPGSASFQWAVLLPAMSAASYAGLHTMTRSMGMNESPVTMSAYIQIVFIVVSTVMGLIFGSGQFSGNGHASVEFIFRAWVMPDGFQMLLLIVAGLTSGFGGYLIGQAYRNSSASLVAPFEYSALILAAFWGFTIWGEVPGSVSAIGIVLILASGIFVAIREGHLNVKATAKRSSGRR